MKACIAFLALTAGACLSSGGSEFAGNARSVEELPLDRFDEYMAGGLPPHPWFRLGQAASGVELSLKAEAESPFCLNKVTGKGLVLSDSSPDAGNGDGIACQFQAPPEGDVYLGFDFSFVASNLKETLDFTARLSGTDGRSGLVLHLGQDGKIKAEAADGSMRELCGIEPQKWYHLSSAVDSAGNVSSALYDFSKIVPKASPNVNARRIGDLLAGKGIPLPGFKIKMPERFERLEFLSEGPKERTGSWTLDNVCMAGRVDAPREELLPFNRIPVEELRRMPGKVFAYYYIFASVYPDEDPGLSGYTRKVLNPSGLNVDVHPDRADAGTEFLYRPLPRPPMPSGLSKDEQRLRAREEELRIARQQGIDGFLVDFWAKPGPANGQATFILNSFAILDAVQRVDPSMKVVPAVYSWAKRSGHHGEADQEVDPLEYANSEVVSRILAHPSVYRLPDGRAVFSHWLTERHSVEWWRKVMGELERKGTPIALLPQFNSYDRMADFAPISWGMAHWGPRTPCKYEWTEKVRALQGVKCVFPIVEQDVRTRGCALWEAQNSETLRNQWRLAIEGRADWAFIYTWSDFSEQAMQPSSCLGFAPSDLNAFYIQWFKTGRQPQIVRDVLYYFHRKHHTEAEQLKGSKWSFIGEGAAQQLDPSAHDQIELLAFLKAPGLLKIEAGGRVFEQAAPAGVSSFKVPLPKGVQFTPSFSLFRAGAAVLSRASRYPVLDKVEYPNLLYCSGVIASGE